MAVAGCRSLGLPGCEIAGSPGVIPARVIAGQERADGARDGSKSLEPPGIHLSALQTKAESNLRALWIIQLVIERELHIPEISGRRPRLRQYLARLVDCLDDQPSAGHVGIDV